MRPQGPAGAGFCGYNLKYMNYKKIILRQIFLLTIIFIASYCVLNWYSVLKEKIDYTANGMLLDLALGITIAILLLVLFPLSLFYFLRIKNKMDIKNLDRIFKTTTWFLIVMIAFIFVSVLWEIFYLEESGISLWTNLKISFLYHFSWSYLSDAEYGFMDDTKQMIIYLPHLFIAGLLYLTLKNNKLLSDKI